LEEKKDVGKLWAGWANEERGPETLDCGEKFGEEKRGILGETGRKRRTGVEGIIVSYGDNLDVEEKMEEDWDDTCESIGRELWWWERTEE
jgi:hypothetical protein